MNYDIIEYTHTHIREVTIKCRKYMSRCIYNNASSMERMSQLNGLSLNVVNNRSYAFISKRYHHQLIKFLNKHGFHFSLHTFLHAVTNDDYH